MNDLLFASVDLPVLDKQQATSAIMEVDQRFWVWDDHTALMVLPLMTRGGKTGRDGVSNKTSNQPFDWVSYAPSVLTDWMDNVVFPWVGTRTRVTALMTKAHTVIGEHFDCAPHNIGSNQHKFRLVLQGKTDTLYFITKEGNVTAPSVDGCFIIDGSWPHGMYNTTDDFKLTLALGAPWTGKDSYDNINVLMARSQYEMPESIDRYFDPRYFQGDRNEAKTNRART